MTTAAEVFDYVAAHYQSRIQTAGYWVPCSDYILEVTDTYELDGFSWIVVHRSRRIVAKGSADTLHGAWRAACAAVADDLNALEAEAA